MTVSDSQAESKNTSPSLSISLSSSCPPISRGYLSFHSNYAEPNAEWQTDVLSPLHFYFLLRLWKRKWTSIRWAFQNPSVFLSLFFLFFPLVTALPLLPFVPLSFLLIFNLCLSVSVPFFHFCLSLHHIEGLSNDMGLRWSHDAAWKLCVSSQTYASAIALLSISVSATFLLTL